MKKNLIIAVSLLFIAGTMLTGCKKESAQSTSASETNDLQVGNNSSCKLTHLVWAYYFTWDFHYNDKGLADEWRIDFGTGYVQNFRMEYDKFNNLIKANGYDDFDNLIFTNSFTYSGNRLISQQYADLLAGTGGEVQFSYNNKGQIVREDDPVNGSYQLLTYDNMGNCIRSDYYLGDYLWYSDRYSFENNVRNPLLTVAGVDFMFPYLGVGYFNKLWFSNNLSIFYDIDGTEYVLNDYDVPQTAFTTGQQNFPLLAKYFDKVSQSPLEISFGYSCNGNNFTSEHNTQNNNINSRNKTLFHPMLSSPKSIKEQINQLKELINSNQLHKVQ